MGRRIEVRRLDLSARELRRRAARRDDGTVAGRVLAIGQGWEGAARRRAARAASAAGTRQMTPDPERFGGSA